MARYREAKCRLCRREGMKLFLKGDRCFRDTCAIEKRNFPPGQHGRDHRPKTVGYGIQLREKQKVKRIYRVLENQFANYFDKAEKKKGITGETLLLSLERRLDNVVCRLGFAPSRDQARQLVTHGHVLVNGKKVDIASAQVKVGDVITLRERTKKESADSGFGRHDRRARRSAGLAGTGCRRIEGHRAGAAQARRYSDAY